MDSSTTLALIRFPEALHAYDTLPLAFAPFLFKLYWSRPGRGQETDISLRLAIPKKSSRWRIPS
jgi:hypothetical protein